MINNYKNIEKVVNNEVNNDLVKSQGNEQKTFYQNLVKCGTGIGLATYLFVSSAVPAFAGPKADVGSKLQKPSIIQRGIEGVANYFTDRTTVDDHFKDGLKEGGVSGILKGTGKALAFAVPYTVRDVLMLPIAIPMGLYKNVGKTSKFLNMGNEDAHILTKSGKVIVFVPAYAYKIAEGAVKKAIKDPCQTTLDVVAASLIIGKVLAENKAVAEDLGIYKHRQRDSNNPDVVVEEKATDPTGGD